MTKTEVLNLEDDQSIKVGIIADAFNEMSCFGLRLILTDAVDRQSRM